MPPAARRTDTRTTRRTGRGIARTAKSTTICRPYCAAMTIPDVTRHGDSRSGTSLIQSASTFATTVIVPSLSSFLDADPNLEIRLDATHEPPAFARESVDIEIRHRRRVPFDRAHMSIDAAVAGFGVTLESRVTTWRERRDGLLICPVADAPPKRKAAPGCPAPPRFRRLRRSYMAASAGAVFSRLTSSLFNAFRYAFTDATMVSVWAPRPSTVLPSSESRTVTSAWASVPPVTAWTW